MTFARNAFGDELPAPFQRASYRDVTVAGIYNLFRLLTLRHDNWVTPLVFPYEESFSRFMVMWNKASLKLPPSTAYPQKYIVWLQTYPIEVCLFFAFPLCALAHTHTREGSTNAAV